MATNRIKGITVEIGGDTTDLQKALKGVNSEIKNTQSALRDVEKLLKLDPKNTELLEQKQKLLAKSVEETNEKLKTLKEAADNASEALASGEMSGDQYDALQREIAETEQGLKSLEEQAEATNKELNKGFDYESAGTKIKDAGSKVASAGDTLTKSVTAPIVALGTAAVATASNFDTSMSQVQATMGITKDAMSTINGESVNTMESLRSLAKEMGSSTAFSASECADALNYLALAGYDTQQMYDTLPTVLSLAAAGSIDLASASDMVTDAMSALGMESSEAETMVDQMAKTASSTNTSVSQLGEGILKIGANAKSLKGGTAELSTALGVLANNGIKGAEGGTHLRNIMLSLQRPTDTGAEALEKMGVSVYDASGSMRSLNDILGDLNTSMSELTQEERTDIIGKIFNKTDLAGANALLASTGEEWNNLQNSITNSSGAASQMAETQLDNLAGQLTLLKSALEGLAISFGELIIPYVRKAVTAIQGVVDWLNSLDEGTKSMIIRIAGLAAVIGPVLSIVGRIMIGIGTIVTAIPKITGVITVLKGAVSGLFTLVTAHPIIAVITAIVGAVWYLWNNCEVFRESIINLWNAIKSGISAIVTGLVSFVTNAWNNLKSTVTSVIQSIKTTGISIFNNMLIGIKTISSSIGTAVINGFNSAVSFLSNLPANAYNWGKDMIDGFVSGIKDMIGTVKSAVGSVAQTVTSFLHFSRPDEGPLREYEKWMPDFMSGLAKGINDNKHLVTNAIGGLTGSMSVNPIINGNVSASTGSRTINLTQPILMNGRTVANVVSEIQYNNSNVSLRSAGRR